MSRGFNGPVEKAVRGRGTPRYTSQIVRRSWTCSWRRSSWRIAMPLDMRPEALERAAHAVMVAGRTEKPTERPRSRRLCGISVIGSSEQQPERWRPRCRLLSDASHVSGRSAAMSPESRCEILSVRALRQRNCPPPALDLPCPVPRQRVVHATRHPRHTSVSVPVVEEPIDDFRSRPSADPRYRGRSGCSQRRLRDGRGSAARLSQPDERPQPTMRSARLGKDRRMRRTVTDTAHHHRGIAELRSVTVRLISGCATTNLALRSSHQKRQSARRHR